MNEVRKHAKQRPQSDLDFKIMSFFFTIRDKFFKPKIKIDKSEIKSGYYIVDYGCGPGTFTIAAAKAVGPSGMVYAIDINSLAIKKVEEKANKNNLQNIVTILTDCKTEIQNDSIDVIICFDTLHAIKNYECVLEEFYRMLKPNSILSIDDHHLRKDEIISIITHQKFFKFEATKGKLYLFKKV